MSNKGIGSVLLILVISIGAIAATAGVAHRYLRAPSSPSTAQISPPSLMPKAQSQSASTEEMRPSNDLKGSALLSISRVATSSLLGILNEAFFRMFHAR